MYFFPHHTFLITSRHSNLPHRHNPHNGSWQCWEWNRWKLAKHLSMCFHHGNTALISAKRMFMLAMPPTTFRLISSDGNFWKRDLKKGPSQEDDKTLHIKRRETTTYLTNHPGNSLILHWVPERKWFAYKAYALLDLGHNHLKSTFCLWAEWLQHCS